MSKHRAKTNPNVIFLSVFILFLLLIQVNFSVLFIRNIIWFFFRPHPHPLSKGEGNVGLSISLFGIIYLDKLFLYKLVYHYPNQEHRSKYLRAIHLLQFLTPLLLCHPRCFDNELLRIFYFPND